MMKPRKLLRADWMARLRSAVDDAHAVTRDQLRAPRDRRLGPVLHRELYDEAAGTIAYLLDNPPEPDPEPSDPAGSGDAGPTH